MHRLMLLVAVVTALFAASTARASQPRSAAPQAKAGRNGPVARLVELERRKNEWLRQRFGR